MKRYENGFITDPICLTKEYIYNILILFSQKVCDAINIKNKYGYKGIPITENGIKFIKVKYLVNYLEWLLIETLNFLILKHY